MTAATAPPTEPTRAPWWRRAVLATAVIIHVVIVASIARQPLDVNHAPPAARAIVWPLFADTTHRLGPAADFFGVYDAGVQPPSPDDLYVDINPRDHPPTRVPYGYAFRYLPVVAYTLSATLRILPPHAAYLAWIGVLELVLLGVLAAFWRASPGASLRVYGAAILLLSFPYFLELHMGQFTFLSIALVLASLALFERAGPRWVRAVGAAAFIAACVLKLFPIVVAPALVRRSRGLVLLVATLVVIVATSVVYFVGHPTAWDAFARVNTGAKMDGLDAGNHGLLYVIYRSVDDAGIKWTRHAWTTFAAVWQLALLGAVGLVALLGKRATPLLGGATLSIAFVLSYVHVWEHHYSGTILAGLVIVTLLAREDGGWSRRVRVAAVAVAVLALPTPFALLDPHPDPNVWDPSRSWGAFAILPPLCKALPAIVLVVIALREMARDGFAAPDYLAVWRRKRAGA